MAKYSVRITSNRAYYIYRKFLWIWWNVGYINNAKNKIDALEKHLQEKVYHNVSL